MRLRSALLVLTLAALGFAPGASANPLTYGGTLAGPSSPGTGTFTITLDPTAQTFQINVSFAKLLGTDTAAHIHCCSLIESMAIGATVLPSWPQFPLGVTQGTYSSSLLDIGSANFYVPTFITAHGGTVAGAEAALVSGIESGEAWFGIHTTAFPMGEIGSQILPAGEPASLALLASAIAGLGMVLRTRRA